MAVTEVDRSVQEPRAEVAGTGAVVPSRHGDGIRDFYRREGTTVSASLTR